MSSQLQKYENGLLSISWEETLGMGEIFAKSGFFSDSKNAAQAVVKMIAGRELGIGAIASLRGVQIVNGQVALSAGLIAALIKRSGKYDYTIETLTDSECVIAFFEAGKETGRERLTMDEAKRRKLNQAFKDGGWKEKATWSMHPRNMLFARCISNGGKFYCPDIFTGPIYAPDEFNADEVVADAEVIATEVEKSTASPTGSRAATDVQMITPKQGEAILALCKAKGRDANQECQQKYKCDFGELSRDGAKEFIAHLTVLGSLTDREQIKNTIKSKLKDLVIGEHPSFVEFDNGKAKYSPSGMLKWLRATAKAKWSIEVNPNSINSSDDLNDALLAEVPALLQAELNELIESRNQPQKASPSVEEQDQIF